MTEEFLQYIWENRLFPKSGNRTINGEPVEIIDVGKRNLDSGPDFFNAKISIDGTMWAGNVEIHLKSSGWKTHKHQDDKSYDNVILHVAESVDKQVTRSNGEVIPTMELRYPEGLRMKYRKLLDARTWIPCEEQFFQVDPFAVRLGYYGLMVERLQSKTEEIRERLVLNKNDWNETFYQMLARSFGFRINSLPFDLLAKAVPLQILTKHRNSLFQIEAILFGASGLLNQQLLGDDYFLKLREEYSFLFRKYKLGSVEGHLWKFMRLRPGNFPTIRISQLASLIFHTDALFSKITESESLEKLRTFFKVSASEYWNQHYNFNKQAADISVKSLGEYSADLILINTVVPFLFVFGHIQNKHHLKDRALHILEQIPPEKNGVTSRWEKMGLTFHSAFDTQAVLQLKNVYCEKKKCLNCHIGNKLLSQM